MLYPLFCFSEVMCLNLQAAHAAFILQEPPSQALPRLPAALCGVLSNPALLFLINATTTTSAHVRLCVQSESSQSFLTHSCRS